MTANPGKQDLSSAHREEGATRAEGWVCFIAACLFTLWSSAQHFTANWRADPRGTMPMQYAAVCVDNQLRHGWAATKGVPVAIAIEDPATGTPTLYYNWHHPPANTHLLAGAAALLGNHEWVLRLAHLALFLPSLLALFLLVRRCRVPYLPGAATVLFATTPLVAFYGPMVMQEGEVLCLGLWTTWSFLRHLSQPGWRSLLLTGALFFTTCSFDNTGYLWGPVLFALALVAPQRWRAMRTVGAMFLASLLALGLLLWHYGLVLGGPMGFVRQAMAATAAEGEEYNLVGRPSFSQYVVEDLGITYFSFGVAGLAALGVILACLPSGLHLRRATAVGAALCVPGLLNCVLFPAHAVNHACWPLQGYAGLALLAGVGAAEGWRRQRQAGWRPDWHGSLVVVLAALVVLGGMVQTWRLLRPRDANEPAVYELVRRSAPLFGASKFVLTTVVEAPVLIEGRYVVGGVTSVQALNVLLQAGRSQGATGPVAFVVPLQHRDLPVVRHLDTLAVPRMAEDMLVYLLPQ